MKKLLALLLVLVISMTCICSCDLLFGNHGDGGENSGENGNENVENDEPVIEEDDGDVEQNLYSHFTGDSKGHQTRKRITLSQGEKATSHHEKRKEGEDRKGAEKAKLFAGDGEDKVVLRLGYIHVFQLAIAVANAEKAT